MRANEVPQDQGSCYEGHLRACYATDHTGSYVIVPSTGWEAEIAVTAFAAEQTAAQIAKVKSQVLAGQVSPLAYHLAKRQMTLTLMAQSSGLWRWRVRRHLNPDVFRRLSPKLKQRYCEVLDLTPAELETCGD